MAHMCQNNIQIINRSNKQQFYLLLLSVSLLFTVERQLEPARICLYPGKTPLFSSLVLTFGGISLYWPIDGGVKLQKAEPYIGRVTASSDQSYS